MNFIAFPVGTTNIFPIANSSAGGQLLTEFNIRSRESVATPSSVKYFIGPSYTHSMDDFAVVSQQDGGSNDATISNTTIQITPGRALVNGHFIESLEPINIDIDAANFLAAKEGLAPLKGELAVGLRVAYSTYQTLAGAMEIEDANGEYYEGIQVVVVPKSAVRLPEDVPGPTEFNKVNMHLLLATFNYRNGAVTGNVNQNKDKIKNLDAERISRIDDLLSDTYVSKKNLDPNKHYVFTGKSSDGSTIDGRDTFCDATGSIMMWANDDPIPTVDPTKYTDQAEFKLVNGHVCLNLPYKQVDGMVNTAGDRVYFPDVQLQLPEADFDANTAGVVTGNYTRVIKDLKSQIDAWYTLPNGRMRGYIEVLTSRDDLPLIPVSDDLKWPYAEAEEIYDITQLESGLNDLKNEVQLIKQSISLDVAAQIQSTVGDVFSKNYEPRLTSIYSSLDSINSRIDQILQQLQDSASGSSEDPQDDLERRMAAAETNIASLRTDVASVRTDIESIRADLVTYTQDIDATVVSKMADLQAVLQSSIDSRLLLAEEKLRELYDVKFAALERRVSDALAGLIDTSWTWVPGDYILVGEDLTVGATIDGRGPSTMYVVGPGMIKDIRYVDSITTRLTIGSVGYNSAYKTMLKKVPLSLEGGLELGAASISNETENVKTLWDYASLKGRPNVDYFVARMKTVEGNVETWTCFYWTPYRIAGDRYTYLDPIWVTGGVPLATENSVGGFVNVPSGAIGNGYVRMDENGYLKLVDYELLLTGVLAYQLGQNYSEGSGVTLEELQGILDEYVNDRIAFPNAAHIAETAESGEDPNVIHLYLYLPDGEGVLNIHDIGSRYGTSVYVHIEGEATSAVTVNFVNCDKLRIDSNISGAPNINLSRVNLYYDSDTFDKIESVENLTLWYERYSDTDPDIQVDGMTVSLVGPLESTESMDPWDSTYANDNHYSYALRSITFGADGSIINIGMLVGDSTTANIDEGKSVFAAPFVLPQGVGLSYPVTRMTHRIKVTGSFVSHYYVASERGYMMKHTEFSALMQKWDTAHKRMEVEGTIAFYTDAQVVTAISGIDSSTIPPETVDCWDLNTPHYFVGGVIE